MKLADLRTRVTIQSKTDTADGIGGRLTAWNDVAAVWASVSPMAGTERYRAERLESNITHKITIRHRDGINAQLRLVTKIGSPPIADRVFAIKHVISRDEGKETWLELLCVEGDPT